MRSSRGLHALIRCWCFIFVGSTVFLAGCSHQATEAGSNSGERIVVDGSHVTDSEDISSIVDKIRIVALEERDEGYIGEIDRVLIHRENYVILDKYVGKQALVFDSAGKYMTKLGEIGRGPNELTQINGIWIKQDTGIDLYDFAAKKIVSYDKDYQVSNTISIRSNPAAFQSVVPIPHSDTYLAFVGYSFQNEPYEGRHYRLAFLDSNFNRKKVARTYDADLSGALITTPVNPFVPINDTIRFFEHFDNAIYDIGPDGQLAKRYILDYRPKPFPADFETRTIKQNLSLFKADVPDFTAIQRLYEGFWGFNGGWLETERYAVFDSFDDKHNSFTSVYDKHIKKMVAQSIRLADSTRYHIVLPPLFASAYQENRFVAVYPGYILKSIVMPKSPFFDRINQYPEKNFLFEITLK